MKVKPLFTELEALAMRNLLLTLDSEQAGGDPGQLTKHLQWKARKMNVPFNLPALRRASLKLDIKIEDYRKHMAERAKKGCGDPFNVKEEDLGV